MNCEHCRDLIWTSYLDGETSDLEKQQVEEHMLRCTDCREVCDAASAAAGLIRSETHVPVPTTVWNKIESTLDAREAAQKKGLLQNYLDKLRALRNSLPEFRRPVIGIGAGVLTCALLGAVLFLPSSHDANGSGSVFLGDQLLVFANADTGILNTGDEQEDLLGSNLELLLMG